MRYPVHNEPYLTLVASFTDFGFHDFMVFEKVLLMGFHGFCRGFSKLFLKLNFWNFDFF
jgi:hypothetical protein